MTFDPAAAIPLDVSGQNGLGEDFVDNNISYNIQYVLAEAEALPGVETITDQSITYSPEYIANYLTISSDTEGITITGNVPISVFDQYSVKYVDKGSSDKLMSPIVTTIDAIPNLKDIIKITVDDRIFIKFDITASVTTETNNNDPADPLFDEFNEENIVTETFTQTFSICFLQTWDMIKNWTDDYFNNRYN